MGLDAVVLEADAAGVTAAKWAAALVAAALAVRLAAAAGPATAGPVAVFGEPAVGPKPLAVTVTDVEAVMGLVLAGTTVAAPPGGELVAVLAQAVPGAGLRASATRPVVDTFGPVPEDVATDVPPIATEMLPLAAELSPLAAKLPPLATMLSPLATMLSPLATELLALPALDDGTLAMLDGVVGSLICVEIQEKMEE